MSERVAGICAELIRRRFVLREEMPELEDDPTLRDEVSRQLGQVGLTLLERAGIPYWGVALAETFRIGDTLQVHGLNQPALGLLLHLWLRLVAPILYKTQSFVSYQDITISKEALRRELPGGWAKQSLEMSLGRLVKLGFIEKIRGNNTVRAGPMLWLAIDHDRLMHVLRTEKGMTKAIERYLNQKESDQI